MTERLSGRVVVVSPHLDDAIFSLGATISRAMKSGARVEVLTVFGCDTTSEAPASGWDSRAGFATEGEAALARRSEDREACGLVGAEPSWLAFPSGSYTPERDRDEIWSAIADAVSGADAVLVPGFPLRNQDHAWLTELVGQRPLATRTAHYAEQPYRYFARREQRLPKSGWTNSSVSLFDHLAKRQAIFAYKSQLPMLSLKSAHHLRLHLMLARELFDQREALAWVPH